MLRCSAFTFDGNGKRSSGRMTMIRISAQNEQRNGLFKIGFYIPVKEYVLTRIFCLGHIKARHDGNTQSAGRAEPFSNHRTIA